MREGDQIEIKLMSMTISVLVLILMFLFSSIFGNLSVNEANQRYVSQGTIPEYSNPHYIPTPHISLSKELIPDFKSLMQKYAGQFYTRTYTWRYGHYLARFTINIPKFYYVFFKSLPRTRYYSAYVTNPYDDPILEKYVKELEKTAKRHKFSKSETAELVISFVQSLKYTSDKVTEGYDEYPRYPIETLVDEGGDCEDTAILAASLLQELGFDVVLLQLPHHMAVGIWAAKSTPGSYVVMNGKRYYYLETTGSGWKVGEVPRVYRNAKVKVIKLNPSPLLAVKRWSIKAVSADSSWVYYVVWVDVINLGKIASKNTVCRVTVIDANGVSYSAQSKKVENINKFSSYRYVFHVKSPWNKRLRVKIEVYSDNHPKLSLHSDWFTPRK